MAIRGIDFVQYSARNWEAAVAFYKDILGLALAARSPEIEYAEFDIGGTTLSIAGPRYGETPIPNYRGGATVALAVDDLSAMVEALRAKGVSILWGPSESKVCWIACIADLEGNRLFLHQRKDGTTG